MKRGKVYGLLILMAVAGFSCGNDETEYEKRIKESDAAIRAYIDENDVDAIKHQTGFYYEELVTNESGQEPKEGEVMYIDYTVSTLEGEFLESNVGEDNPALFRLNWNTMAPGALAYGVGLMKKGEKIRFYIPFYQAFGNFYDPEVFEPFTNFIVEVELLDIKTESIVNDLEKDSIDSYIANSGMENVMDFSSGLYYKVLEEGVGSVPANYNTVSFHFTRKYLDGTVIETTADGSPLTVNMNEGRLVAGLKEGIMKMKEGERALLVMPSKIAFGSSVQVIPMSVRAEMHKDGLIPSEVKPYAPVMYEVELLDVY